ncbi:glycosyltransferase [Aeromonas veronii]|nr:glycosyltransferase [Aeromonas veronii]
MVIQIAVVMSVYKSDSPEFVKLSIDSLLCQSLPSYIYIDVDGIVGDNLLSCLKKYENKKNVFITYHDENIGLAGRLNGIIERIVSSEDISYIARMDADDISFSKRFERQVEFLLENKNVDVVGSDVIEIDSAGNEIFYKKMDVSHDLLYKNIIKKCPFNHPTVMFRTSIFKEGFRYKDSLLNTQDYYFWVDLLAAGKIFSNIDFPLLYFRVDENFHNRRGWNKAVNDFKARLYAFKNLKVMTVSNIIHTVLLFILRISPIFVKKFAYKKLRKGY